MGTSLAVLALTGAMFAAAGTLLSVGWLILAGGITLLVSALAVPSTRAPYSPVRRRAPRSFDCDVLENLGGCDIVAWEDPLPEMPRDGHRRIVDGTAERGSQP